MSIDKIIVDEDTNFGDNTSKKSVDVVTQLYNQKDLIEFLKKNNYDSVTISVKLNNKKNPKKSSTSVCEVNTKIIEESKVSIGVDAIAMTISQIFRHLIK